MADNGDTTRRFGDQPDWVTYLLTRVDSLGIAVESLRERFDARDRETTPLAETLEAFRVELRELREGQQTLREGQEALREGQEALRAEMHVELRRLNTKSQDIALGYC